MIDEDVNRTESLPFLLREIRACRHCESSLPLGPRPVLALSANSRILIVGQAPGKRVHESGVAWDDPSGKRLRMWMGVSDSEFYDNQLVAIVPMGFCYPGKGKSGDLPPRPECAELFHTRVMKQLRQVELTLLIGQYSQAYMLGASRKTNLTLTVKAWKEYRPKFIPTPHPSPRNNRWFRSNPWFEKEILPYLKRRIRRIINKSKTIERDAVL